jgi:putative FmdB family regulatory protein|tara:strand:+ start:5188 stop:5604 length:417 start_codon:yes stop_codon:yes gene_type:complete
MPFYDFKCPDGCGYFEDIFVPLAEHGKTTCPECSSLLTTVISEVALVGPMPSKPIVIKQVGKSFETGSAYRQYQRENPGFEVVSENSSTWQKHHHKAREKAEAKARKQGYRDFEAKQVHRKKEKAKRTGKVDKKIFIH